MILRLEVGYSSTCPCSAALARQLIQQQFEHDFAAEPHPGRDEVYRWLGRESGIVATPHSQRSQVMMALRLGPEIEDVPMIEVIDSVEQSLGTALQTAVKRPDEPGVRPGQRAKSDVLRGRRTPCAWLPDECPGNRRFRTEGDPCREPARSRRRSPQ